MQDLFQRVIALRLPLHLLVAGLTLSGCMVEPARNPGAKAAERAAARRSTGEGDATIVKASAVSTVTNSSLPSKLQSGLSLTLPQTMPGRVKQVQVTLDPMVALPEYDCNQGVANRVMDHQKGSFSTYILPGRGQDAQSLNRYFEKFDVRANNLELIDLAPGRYVLTVELLDAVNVTVFDRSQIEIVITAGSLSALKMDFDYEGLDSSDGSLEIALDRPSFQGQAGGSKHDLFGHHPDARLAPYSSVCSVAELSSNEEST